MCFWACYPAQSCRLKSVGSRVKSSRLPAVHAKPQSECESRRRPRNTQGSPAPLPQPCARSRLLSFSPPCSGFSNPGFLAGKGLFPFGRLFVADLDMHVAPWARLHLKRGKLNPSSSALALKRGPVKIWKARSAPLSRRKRGFHLRSTFYSSCLLVSVGNFKALAKKKKSIMKKR